MKYGLIVLCSLLLAACGSEEKMAPGQEDLLHRLADRPVTCKGKKDCGIKWARAIQWVKEHATIRSRPYETYEIRKLTDTMIQTSGESTTTVLHTTDNHATHYHEFYPGYQIIKYPREDGTYGMDFSTVCDHFVCNPSGRRIRADFVTYIMGLPEGVTEVKPGVFHRDD